MAHFAKIGDTSKVLAVHAVDSKDILNADGVEEEAVGQKYLEKHNNWPAEKWIQTSYNTRGGKHYDNKTGELSADQSKALRGNYAGIGYTWDEDNNIFYPKKPYTSWVLNTSEARWQSPIGDAPDLGEESETHRYGWNESNQSWDKIANPT
jgi:hypothetical protein